MVDPNNGRLNALEHLVTARQHTKRGILAILAPTPDNELAGRELALAALEIRGALEALDRLQVWREIRDALERQEAHDAGIAPASDR
jgi:hypothetical protein